MFHHAEVKAFASPFSFKNKDFKIILSHFLEGKKYNITSMVFNTPKVGLLE